MSTLLQYYSHRSTSIYPITVPLAHSYTELPTCLLSIYHLIIIHLKTICTLSWDSTVGGLETETCKHCTGDSPFKDTVLLIVSYDRVVSWAACASWKACYPF
jgi:hypothetical protein